MADIPVERLKQELEGKIQGDLLWDQMSRMLFSTDASLYQQTPLGVVLPETRVDLLQAVRTAAKYRVPILPRGAAPVWPARPVTRGLVIDDSKHMNRLLEVNPQQRWARVEPGIVLDNLNHALGPHGLFFAPDLATASRATVGGMLGTTPRVCAPSATGGRLSTCWNWRWFWPRARSFISGNLTPGAGFQMRPTGPRGRDLQDRP